MNARRARRERRQQTIVERRAARNSKLVTVRRMQGRNVLALIVAFALGAALVYPIVRYKSTGNKTAQRILTVHPRLTLGRLLEMNASELANVDIAEMNLICARDLPGSGNLDVQTALKIVDHWTDQIDLETRRNRHRFKEHPEEYENSEIYYLMGMIVTVLQQDLGVRYNPHLTDSENLPDSAFLSDVSNVFLSGLLSDKRIGTCASMPVLYVAIGRRLGYPVNLVNAHDHLFVRWQRPGEEGFRDIEATSRGVVFQTDDYYRNWRKIPDEEIKSGVSLHSLTPEQELATFMHMRAGALQFHKRLPEAVVAYSEAARLWPENQILRTYLADAIVRLAPHEFAPISQQKRWLSPQEMIDQQNRELLKREHSQINWDLVEQKNHTTPKKP